MTVELTCRICRHVAAAATSSIREMMFGTRETFDYALCPRCGCLQIVTIPADLRHHYPADYYSLEARSNSSVIASRSPLKSAVVRWYCRSAVLRPQSRTARLVRDRLPVPKDFVENRPYLEGQGLRSTADAILDVGCGSTPTRLVALRRYGFSAVEGIDPFVEADLRYRGVPVYRRSIEDHHGEYAIIMFHHSLEHLVDPISALNSAKRMLRAGGTCIVRTPVMGTRFWREFGTDWVELDAPRHLHVFSAESMGLAAQRAGLKVRQIVFDSQPWEWAASMHYRNDVPLRSVLTPLHGFAADDIKQFAGTVERLNATADAGRACFYLEHS